MVADIDAFHNRVKFWGTLLDTTLDVGTLHDTRGPNLYLVKANLGYRKTTFALLTKFCQGVLQL